MSFLRWFGKKATRRESVPEPSSDLGQVDVTLPINPLMQAPLPPDKGTDLGDHKNERGERRELLYGVVRECMTASGVLSATYKFKVLSLDTGGRKYQIMVDMPHDQLDGAAYFTDIEGTIARSAKERYNILVTAVYWRVNAMVSAAGLLPHAPVQTQEVLSSTTVPQSAASSPYAELQAEEVLAFKRAVAAAASGVAPRSETRKAPRVRADPMPDFSDTEPFEPAAPLGPTQFGGLD